MPFLVMFSIPITQGEHTSEGSARRVLIPGTIQGHDAYVKRLRDQGYLHSCKSSPSGGADAAAVGDSISGYILLCSTLEEAQTLVQSDPLWPLCKDKMHLVPWSLDEDRGTESESKSRSTATTQQRPSILGFDPIFPVTDMQRSLQHYQALGFETEAYDGEYAFATLPGLGCIHLTLQTENYDPKVSAAATYLHVENADALSAKWKRDCPEGDTREPVDTEYGLREGAHLDPDNNLIRFGSKIVKGESNK